MPRRGVSNNPAGVIRTSERAKELNILAQKKRRENKEIREIEGKKTLAEYVQDELNGVVEIEINGERVSLTKKKLLAIKLVKEVMKNPSVDNVKKLIDVLGEQVTKIEGDLNIKQIRLNYEFGGNEDTTL